MVRADIARDLPTHRRPPWSRHLLHRKSLTVVATQSIYWSPWSNGQIEGQINQLKMLKRVMYGRANAELLRAHILRFRSTKSEADPNKSR
ncbi:hypothetical protein B1812_08500 [Methylocystis bryophila]|uniref:Transposase IS204/IS1001/IS1096/IS1165 DDE domain-containing protein n=1 Tax=Methylocystis bryophila TaxID=655015 RepID=A0A1W6MU38_9HYPH|nr:hypothetical protein B1812_08500 [Methylocystis bryophila]